MGIMVVQDGLENFVILEKMVTWSKMDNGALKRP